MVLHDTYAYHQCTLTECCARLALSEFFTALCQRRQAGKWAAHCDQEGLRAAVADPHRAVLLAHCLVEQSSACICYVTSLSAKKVRCQKAAPCFGSCSVTL